MYERTTKGEIMSNRALYTGAYLHDTFLSKHEGDKKRHKTKCVYYDKTYCDFYNRDCYGSAHCDKYKERLFVEKNVEIKKTLISAKKEKKNFLGIKSVPIEELYVREEDIVNISEAKVESRMNSYKKHGKFVFPIIVSCYGNMYKVEDHYVEYVASKRLGLMNVSIEIIDKKNIKLFHVLHYRGNRIWDSNEKEEGIVIETIDSDVIVRLVSGKEKRYNIQKALEKNIFRIVKTKGISN